MIRQLSFEKGVNVFYCCFRVPNSSGFPLKTDISDKLRSEVSGTKAAAFIERFCAYFVAAMQVYLNFKKRCDINQHCFDTQSNTEYQKELLNCFNTQLNKIKLACSSKRPENGRLETLENSTDWSNHLYKYVFQTIYDVEGFDANDVERARGC